MTKTLLLPVLRLVDNAQIWKDVHGVWQLNGGKLADDARPILDRWAVCDSGRTADLTREGWELLHGPEAASTPAELGSEPDGPLRAVSDGTSPAPTGEMS